MIEFVGLFGGWEVSLKRPVLESVVRLAGCVSYKSRAGNCQVFCRGGAGGLGGGGGSLKSPVLESVGSFVGWRDSLLSPLLESISSVGGWIVSVKRSVLNSV